MTTIRPFCNADLPELVDIWVQHWSLLLGPPPAVSAAKIEQAILARTFFDPATLLLAKSNEGVEAWCHYAPSPEAEQTAVICAFCLSQSCPPELGQQLLADALGQIAEGNFQRVEAGVVRDDRMGYAGLEPIGHGIGIPEFDARVSSLLGQSGFEATATIKRMVASTAGYRPPISRAGLQYRRATEIRCERPRYSDRRIAASMSHLDVDAYQLVDRQHQELARVDLWASDPEAEIMRASMAILDISAAHQRGRLEPAELYLVGALTQSLAGHHIDRVETAVDSDRPDLLAQLQALQFQAVEEGVRWTKSVG